MPDEDVDGPGARALGRIEMDGLHRVGWHPLVDGPEMLVMEIVTDRAVHRVRLMGELDVTAALTVEAQLVEGAGSRVEIDLTALSLLDARGLAALLGAKRRIEKAGTGVRMVGAHGIVRRVFELTGLSGELTD